MDYDIDAAIFAGALTATYLANPCQVLPNALWKTLTELAHLETALTIKRDVITRLEAWAHRRLIVHWLRDRRHAEIFTPRLADLSLALVHQDFLDAVPGELFPSREPYFRLMSKCTPTHPQVPAGFRLVGADLAGEAGEMADLINQCYPDMHQSEATVQSWAGHPTFDPSLWLWVVDETRDIPAGLGIAEVDRSIGEGSLEWIQVLPAYRGRGLGTALVQALLAGLAPDATFATVSGQVDSVSHAEALYRRCGFTGNDVWWVLRR